MQDDKLSRNTRKCKMKGAQPYLLQKYDVD